MEEFGEEKRRGSEIRKKKGGCLREEPERGDQEVMKQEKG